MNSTGSDRAPGAAAAVPHMGGEAFRALGHRLVDWIADYWDRVGDMPVAPATAPGEIFDALPAAAPEAPGGEGEWGRILGDLDRLVTPHLLHWQHPGFFGFFPCNVSGPAVLGELVSAGLNVNGMLWATSPALTEIESRVLDWCVDLFGLPQSFKHGRGVGGGGGSILTSASEATLVALLAARERERTRRHGAARTASVATEEHLVFASEDAHSSVIKAAMIAGIAAAADDRRHVRRIRMGADGRMDLRDLRSQMDRVLASREEGHEGAAQPWPIAVVGTVGTTSLGAVDPVGEIRGVLTEACRARGLDAWDGWVHADAAYAGCALVCPEHRWMALGLERADSACINPHKWLLTNFDCDLFWTADSRSVRGALSITPEYLRNEASESGAVSDYRDWQVSLGRRFRALKLWFVLRHYGAEGLRAFVREHVAWAAWLEERLGEDPRFELAAPRVASLVCLRHAAGDAATRELHARLNATGRVYLTHTTSPAFDAAGDRTGEQRYVLRAAIGGTFTRFEHVELLWSLLDEHAGPAPEPAAAVSCPR